MKSIDEEFDWNMSEGGCHVAESIVERRVWANSASGYVRSAFRLVLGVASFRLLCTELSIEELGFYGLVWSLLGYGVLCDLGMGVAVQKRTAELIQRQDWNQLGRVLSSVLVCNCACAIVIITIGFLGTDPLLRAIGVSSTNEAGFRTALRIFVVGMGALGPLEMFREVHYGQQRIAFADRASTVNVIASFVCLVFALRMHWGLPLILGLQITCTVLTGVVLAISALRAMPEVRLGIKHVSWSALRGIAKFSATAYLVVVAGIAVLQMDRFLIGAILSVSAVAGYHVGAKIPELFATFTRQLPEAFAPAAATLHGAGDSSDWQRFLLRGVRFNALITTPLFFLCLIFLEDLLVVLTRGRIAGSEVVLIGRVLLVWSYSTILTHGITKAAFLMCGREARLVRLLVVEAIANIALSFFLLQWLKSPLGAALGSFIPALIIGWCFLWPWTAREIGATSASLAQETLVPAFGASVPLLVFGVLCRFVPALESRSNLPLLLIKMAAAGCIAAAGTWRVGLTPDERGAFVAKFGAY